MTLCDPHKAAAVLPTGERLSAFLAREKAMWPEGELYSYLINPVDVEGHRGWLHFKFGGYAILEELFPSADFSEWLAMHWGADRLYKIACISGGPEVMAVRGLYTDWLYLEAVRGELAKRGVEFPRSVGEAYEVVSSLPHIASDRFKPGVEHDQAARAIYQSLVARRFGHLPEFSTTCG